MKRLPLWSILILSSFLLTHNYIKRYFWECQIIRLVQGGWPTVFIFLRYNIIAFIHFIYITDTIYQNHIIFISHYFILIDDLVIFIIDLCRLVFLILKFCLLNKIISKWVLPKIMFGRNSRFYLMVNLIVQIFISANFIFLSCHFLLYKIRIVIYIFHVNMVFYGNF